MTKEKAQYINSVHTCSLCTTMPLQYVLLMLYSSIAIAMQHVSPKHIELSVKDLTSNHLATYTYVAIMYLVFANPKL